MWPKMPTTGEDGMSKTMQSENPTTNQRFCRTSDTSSWSRGRHILVDSGLCPCPRVLSGAAARQGSNREGFYSTYCQIHGLSPRMAESLCGQGEYVGKELGFGGACFGECWQYQKGQRKNWNTTPKHHRLQGTKQEKFQCRPEGCHPQQSEQIPKKVGRGPII